MQMSTDAVVFGHQNSGQVDQRCEGVLVLWFLGPKFCHSSWNTQRCLPKNQFSVAFTVVFAVTGFGIKLLRSKKKQFVVAFTVVFVHEQRFPVLGTRFSDLPKTSFLLHLQLFVDLESDKEKIRALSCAHRCTYIFSFSALHISVRPKPT